MGTFFSALLSGFLFIPLSHLQGQIADNQLLKLSTNLEKTTTQTLKMCLVTWLPYTRDKGYIQGDTYECIFY